MYSIQSIKPHYDAVVVGARCAGAATALLLAKSGARVLMIDRQAYGSDTLSTHALMRGAVMQLSRWGLIPGIDSNGTPPIRSTTFHYFGDPVSVAIKPEQGVDCLIAPRRTVLDRLLVDAARAAGVEVHHGTALSELQLGPRGQAIGASLLGSSGAIKSVRAGIIIGADGRQSTVARLVGAATTFEGVNASGIAFGYFENLPHAGFHWYFADHVAAGVIPTNAGHCVFAAVPAAEFGSAFRGDVMGGFLRILEKNSSELRAEMELGTLNGRLRAFGGVPGHLRQCHGPGWALVGDAGYFKDPLTAHGITDALRDAELLARAIATGTMSALATYQQERDELSLPFLRLTDAIASLDWGLEEIKQLHARLSDLMKAEVRHLASLPTLSPLAA
jgi:menaquinone-9 beta-reductase